MNLGTQRIRPGDYTYQMISLSFLSGDLTKKRPVAITNQIGANTVELPIPGANPPTQRLVKFLLTSRSSEVRCMYALTPGM